MTRVIENDTKDVEGFPWANLPPKERMEKLTSHYIQLESEKINKEIIEELKGELKSTEVDMNNQNSDKYFQLNEDLLLEVNDESSKDILKILNGLLTKDLTKMGGNIPKI